MGWWLAAIGAGVVETLIRLTLPDSPTAGQVAVRFTIYAALAALVRSLRTGRPAVRWVVAVLLGGVGTFSLVAEPVAWLWAGGSVPAFLIDADGPTWALVAVRTTHLVAVVTATTAMFSPAASAYFHRRAPSAL